MISVVPQKRCRNGFSLVEVNLAILLVALGMVTLFGLFPAGLREGESAVKDTQVALFADFVMGGLRANASTITNWNDWRTMRTPPLPAHFRIAVVEDIGSVSLVTHDPQRDPPPGTVSGPVSFSGGDLHYILELRGDDYRDAAPTVSRRRTASLWVMSGTYVTKDVSIFKSQARFFYTEFFFLGSMP